MTYLVSKIFTALFLPPGLFVIILAILTWATKGWVRRIVGASAIFLYLTSIHPVADKLLLPFEKPFRNRPLPSKADAVVALGGGQLRGDPIPLANESFKRAIYAVAIGKSLDIPVIVAGRGHGGYDEFHALLDSLNTLQPILAHDIPVSKKSTGHFSLIPETKSRDTYENVVFSQKIIGKDDCTLIIVTSAYHMRRALMLFEHVGIHRVYPAAVNFYTNPSKSSYRWRDYLPSMWALFNSYRAMHEFFGIVKVKLRGALN
ncbi:YdcF family protein [Hydrogenimonas sp.]